jgi:signal transduction histidine kinase
VPGPNLKSQPQALERVLEIGRLLSSTLDLAELLPRILNLASSIVQAETGSLLLLDEKKQELYFDVALGLGPEISNLRFKLGEGIAGSVAKDGKALLINDAPSDPRWSGRTDQHTGFQTRSILAVPILVKDKLLGVVEAINKKNGNFSDEDLNLFTAFASQAGIAIENARLFASLNEERFKLETVFMETTDGIILAETSGKIILANAAARVLFSKKDAGTLAAAFAGFSIAPAFDEIVSKHSGSSRFRAERKDPKLLILAGLAAPVQQEELLKRPAWLWVFRDKTDDWQEQRLKSDFLSLISHKLRTPLTAILGFSDILRRELKSQDGENSLLMPAETIHSQAGKLSSLVDKLLRYVHLENPQAPTERKPCALAAISEEAVSALSFWLKENKALVKISKQTEGEILGDPAKLREAVKNLLENAVKFDLKPEKTVLIEIGAQGDKIQLCVEDKGPGIPPEDQAKLFNRFHQIEGSFTGQIEGWGLGLPFVKKVVESHGGTIELDSRLGQGTRVICRFPKKSS